jgi:lipoyl(octanoyl) transferase
MSTGGSRRSAPGVARFIDDGWRSGKENMARDESLALLAPNEAAPTLRVYRFGPPCVTIGRFQHCPEAGEGGRRVYDDMDVARRPTGGLAIPHRNDFTYSVTMRSEGRGRWRKEWYFSLVAGGLVEALQRLSVDASLSYHEGNGSNESTWCFERAAGIDVEWAGRKLCGSAQRMWEDSVLQHGTIFLADPRMAPEGMAEESSSNVFAGIVTLEEAAGRRIEWEVVREAFRAGFSTAFGLSFKDAALSDEEEALSRRLLERKYSCSWWLARPPDRR